MLIGWFREDILVKLVSNKHVSCNPALDRLISVKQTTNNDHQNHESDSALLQLTLMRLGYAKQQIPLVFAKLENQLIATFTFSPPGLLSVD